MRRISEGALLLLTSFCSSLFGQATIDASSGSARLLVRTPVAVVNAKGAVTGHNPCGLSFGIREGQMPQLLESCVNSAGPVSVGVLIDTSGSMRAHRELIHKSVVALLAVARSDDEYCIMLSGDRLRRPRPFVSPTAELAGILDGRAFKGLTAILYGVRAANLEFAGARNARRALVVMSDGGDNLYEDDASLMAEQLLRGQVALFFVRLFDPLQDLVGPGSASPEGRVVLDKLAEDTGGRTFAVHDAEGAENAVRTIASMIHGSALLSYYSSNPARDGSYRRIKIELNQERGSPPLRLHYPQGYYAPNQ